MFVEINKKIVRIRLVGGSVEVEEMFSEVYGVSPEVEVELLEVEVVSSEVGSESPEVEGELT